MEKYSEYLTKLWRPSIKPIDPPGYECLNHNEAPFSAFETELNLRKYPDTWDLHIELADYFKLRMTQILLTVGTEQGLRFVFDSFLDYGDEVVYPDPTFGMIDVFAYYNKVKVKYLLYDRNRFLPLEKILEAITPETKLFYLANPDNPTGASYTFNEIESIARHSSFMNTIFLLDEAYWGYYEIDSLPLLKHYKNLIIVRSFSKAWGLAGLRAGFLISNERNIKLLRSQKPMNELSSYSIYVCRKALKISKEAIDKNVKQVKKWKFIFRNESFEDLEYLESEGNFIILRSKNFKYYNKLLMNNKILVRADFTHLCLKSCIRFSVGRDVVMNKILNLFRGA